MALGLIQDGKPVLGVLGCPNLPADISKPDASEGRGQILIGIPGHGAFTTGLDDDSPEVPVSVSACDNPEKATFVQSVEKGHSNHSAAADIGKEFSGEH